MYAGSMLWDAFQMGDDIATGDAPINSTASLLFDGIGYAGATNRLRPITIRIPRSRSTSGLPRSHQMTINTDKVADVTGTGFNVLDGSNDVYGIGKFGLNYANAKNPNLIFEPFSYDDGKDKNKSVLYYDSSTGEYSSDLSPKLTILNRIGDDPTQWTYTDDEGRLYTPIQTQVNSGEINQRKLKFPASNTYLYNKFASIQPYTQIYMECEVVFSQNSVKLVPINVETEIPEDEEK